jgi:hypothetical protein
MNRVSGAVVLWSGAVVFMQRSVVFLERCEAIVKLMNHCFSQYRRQAGSKAHLAPVLLRRPVVNPQGSRFLARS